MTREQDCSLIGKWRITALDLAHDTGSAPLEDDDTLSRKISFHPRDDSGFKDR